MENHSVSKVMELGRFSIRAAGFKRIFMYRPLGDCRSPRSGLEQCTSQSERQIGLRPFQGMNALLLFDHRHQRAVSRMEIDVDDLDRLHDELWIVTDAPGFEHIEIDLLRLQKRQTYSSLTWPRVTAVGSPIERTRPAGGDRSRSTRMRRPVPASYLADDAYPPGGSVSARPLSTASAKRIGQRLAVHKLVARFRASAKPSAASSTLRARHACRRSAVGARRRALSSARRSGASWTSGAMGNIPHDASCSHQRGY